MHRLLLEILVLMLLSLEMLQLQLRLVVLLLMLLSLEVVVLLSHHCQLDIGWWREAVGHGERVVGFERVDLSRAAFVGHAGDLLPPCFVLVEAVE